MKKLFVFFISFVLFSLVVFANGAAVVNSSKGVYLKLLSSNVDIKIENQVAITTVTQTYKNTLGNAQNINYIFPLSEGGSATELLFYTNGQWKRALFTPRAQDTVLNPGQPGEQMNTNLKKFIGKTPLYFNVPDSVKADSILIIKLTYVELLKYSNGKVEYKFPADISLIQTENLQKQNFNLVLFSERKVINIKCLNHIVTLFNQDNFTTVAATSEENTPANRDYRISYELSQDQLGLFGFSTSIADSLLPDDMGHGFFLFTAEPDSRQTSQSIKKAFSLIIDRSGSMSGTKFTQAIQAATFIVNNLNEGDYFNIIGFESYFYSFKNSLVPFNEENKIQALAFLSNMALGGGTDIAGALGLGISQFPSKNDTTAKIIVFLTDGEPTSGITNTDQILKYVSEQTGKIDSNISIFCFGIGSGIDTRLLTLLSSQHKGLAEFLNTDEVESRISQFYSKIRNPVLLNTKLEVYPPKAIDVFPDPLPNLYKGEQFVVAGRYKTGGPVTFSLTGSTFGRQALYSYQVNLSDSSESKYQFLTKVWAKLKIENLLVKYYSLDTTSEQAKIIKQYIKEISVAYGVLSSFTSLTGGAPSGINENGTKNKELSVSGFELLGNYPNPFNPSTKIVFYVNNYNSSYAVVKIYNMLGELIKTIVVTINSRGKYEVLWDGKSESGSHISSGNYIYTISIENQVLAGKMQLIK
jgi:Ca-activated chloride channel family protein